MMRAQKKSRIIALILTLVLLFSMGGVVNAEGIEEGSTAEITINNVENEGRITAYKVIDVNFDFTNQQPVDPVYKWNDSVAGWLEGQTSYSDYFEEDSNVVTDIFISLGNDSDAIKKFVDSLANAIKSGTISLSESSTISWGPESQYTSPALGMGAYLILVEGGVKIYNPLFASVYPSYNEDTRKWELANDTINLTVKGKEPTITKTVDKPTVAIGDTVTYTLTIDVPQYPTNALDKRFAFGDILPAGLTLVEDSFKIIEPAELGFCDYFTKTDSLSDGKSEVSFEYYADTYDELAVRLNGATQIKVEYQAKVSNEAYDGYDYTQGLVNEAYIEYDNNPYTNDGYVTKTDDEKVYTYALQITKEGSDEAVLPGAEFVLQSSSSEGNMKFVKDEDAYRIAVDSDSDENISEKLVSDSSGIIIIKGLDVGTYTLTEVKAPDGYMLPSESERSTTITLSDESVNDAVEGTPDPGPDGKLDTESTANGTYVTGNIVVSENKLSFNIENVKPTTDLPTTGGIGTVIFTVTGIIVMGGAVALLVAASRKKKNH